MCVYIIGEKVLSCSFLTAIVIAVATWHSIFVVEKGLIIKLLLVPKVKSSGKYFNKKRSLTLALNV